MGGWREVGSRKSDLNKNERKGKERTKEEESIEKIEILIISADSGMKGVRMKEARNRGSKDGRKERWKEGRKV